MVNEQALPNVTVNIADALPILPLRGAVAFPATVIPLSIEQSKFIKMIDDAMRTNRQVLLVTEQTDTPEDEVALPDLYKMGTVGFIHQLTRTSNGKLLILLQGLERAHILDLVSVEPYLVARIEVVPEQLESSAETEGLKQALLVLFKSLMKFVDDLPKDLIHAAENLKDVRQLAGLIALTAPLETSIRQEVLEINQIDNKLRRLVELLQHELAVRELGRRITTQTHVRMNKQQRDYYLREQIRSIQKELGEGHEQMEVNKLREQIEALNLPEEVKPEVERELTRLASIPPASAEYSTAITYLDWIVHMPWNSLNTQPIDIAFAKKVLDEDHYDLEKIKDRILEHLAVKKLRQDRLALKASKKTSGKNSANTNGANTEELSHEPILCFVGAPGVGKTSLGQSIARALGREFARISLGGVHDEAEIRGHRRTYIGAMPGRFVQALRQAKSRNPIIILDEIDKLSTDWRGDPSSALLEVLDPAQNHKFVDNYLGVPFDLSQVFFIATANTLETIPGPLLDRMEVLHLSGYTDAEKVHIAKLYLIPKQLKAHGLFPEEVTFTDDVIKRIIRGYTREAGVRNLERQIATVCRKIARSIAEGNSKPIVLDNDLIDDYLSHPRFFDEVAERVDRPGVATGMAWTATGGDILFIEATMIPSRGKQLILTGMLGDVMKESAQAALSYVHSNAATIGIPAKSLENKTIHIHVPAGAIPKDGPSAGVTMVTALASLVTSRLVKSHVAMTGEISLRGKVLPVGGIKEKVLAAHRAGIKTIILPRHNGQDLDDIPPELKQQLQFILVDTLDEVLANALESKGGN